MVQKIVSKIMAPSLQKADIDRNRACNAGHRPRRLKNWRKRMPERCHLLDGSCWNFSALPVASLTLWSPSE
jgi:hypothetical protein